MLIAPLSAYPAQPKPSKRKATPLSSACGISRRQNENLEIRFDYYPTVGNINVDESGLVFVSIHKDGKVKVVRYGPYFKVDPVTVYQGTLSKVETQQLTTRIRKITSVWKPDRQYSNGFQDESIVHLSVTPQKHPPSEIKYWGLLGVPPEVVTLVDELRMLWKRFEEIPTSYAYIRSKPFTKEFQAQRNPHHIPIQKFPRVLRSIIVKAINDPLNFHALSSSQVKQLLAINSDQYLLSVRRNGLSYGLTLYVPQKKPPTT